MVDEHNFDRTYEMQKIKTLPLTESRLCNLYLFGYMMPLLLGITVWSDCMNLPNISFYLFFVNSLIGADMVGLSTLWMRKALLIDCNMNFLCVVCVLTVATPKL